MKHFILSIVTLTSCIQAETALEETKETKPNFIIIFTDDQGYQDLGCYGSPNIKTPNIDQMAKDGARLTNFYVSAPICTPSRASLMTGCYAPRVGMNNFVCLASDSKGLNPSEITIAEIAKSAGYKTGMFGKWHLGDQPEFLPTNQGFDEFFGLPYSHDIHPKHPNKKKYNFPPLPLLEGQKVVEKNPDSDFLTKRFTERSVNFIKKNSKNPFFLYVAHPIPHRPLHASPPFLKNTPQKLKNEIAEAEKKQIFDYSVTDKIYAEAVNEVDWSVGEILKALDETGIANNTIVLFTSDNGPSVGSALPLSGRKGSTLEGGMRMPTVIRWGDKIPAGKDNKAVMSTIDLLPTFANIMGAEIPNERVIDGKDIYKTLVEHSVSPHEYFFYYSKTSTRAVRWGKWKLHLGKKHLKLVDLSSDIKEKHNLAKMHPEITSKLKNAIKDFEADLKKNSRPLGVVEKTQPLTPHE